MTNKAKSAALYAVRFACRVQILTRRLREERKALGEREGDLEAGQSGEEALAAPAHSQATPHGRLTPQPRVNTPGVPAGASPTSLLSRKSNGMALMAELAMVEQGHHHSWVLSDLHALASLVSSSWVSALLVFCPLGIASGLLHWGAAPTFFMNFLVLIPLAMTLGDVTEDLALRMGDVAGGLLNATFGNVTELVLSISALRQGLLDVVADSLLGSILANLLLVLGCCFLMGGIYYKTQSFNATSNRAFGSLLFLSSIGIALPTTAATMTSNPDRPQWILQISRGVAVILLLCYVCYLVFQLHTHHDLFNDMDCSDVTYHHTHLQQQDATSPGGEVPQAPLPPAPGRPATCALDNGSMVLGLDGLHEPLLVGDPAGGALPEESDEAGEGLAQEHDMPVISATVGVAALALISVLVAVHSELLTHAIEQTSVDTGISTDFLAFIVLPIAGNACEHITAVMVALKNKMDLSLGIAIGSSLQIALFAIPLMVILGWCMGQPMSLDYDVFSVIVLVLSAIHANLVSADAQSHWLMGVQLCAVYVLIAIIFWFR